MMRDDGEERLARDTSLLFPFFAQWFTDSFLRTDPSDYRKNQSNHAIDLCQIYGMDSTKTEMLRTKRGRPPKSQNGLLKSQLIDGEEYGEFLFERGEGGNAILKKEFLTLYDEVNFKRVFDDLTDEQRLRCFAVGLEHGNSTLGNVLMNTLFLREHNRLARLLKKTHSDWSGDQIFETARNINIVLLLKIVVQDYVRHISGFDVPLEVTPGLAEEEDWYRTNWIAVEFNLLYRWHGLIPNSFRLGTDSINSALMVNANELFMETGVDQLVRDASKQKAGRIGLGQTPAFLRAVKEKTVRLARKSNLKSYNDYRKHFSLDAFTDFDQLTSDSKLAKQLKTLYGSIDNVEYLVGLLAEDYADREMMGELQLTMVAHDAFTHVLTNPLLAKRVFNKKTFSSEGMSEIADTNTLADVIVRNSGIADTREVSFKFKG
ncbi:MAG: hypothetical protein IH973_10835 [Myxococcales bacterium]|nr:hypothetical protein [Myxococcales bacterium]